MSVRRTSIETYRQIEAEGLLSKMRFEAYELLFNYGPLTANQLMQQAKLLNPAKSHQSLESIGRRLSELRDVGVIYEVKEINCPVTGRPVILWDVTEKLPLKWDKPKKHKCKTCAGRGYILEQQSKLNI